MSVLIRGMEMPLSCWHSCTLKKVTIMGGVYCPLINKYMERGEIGTRHPDCPLVEVKEPHGRLIDADALLKKAPELQEYLAVLATVVIEAEGSEE